MRRYIQIFCKFTKLVCYIKVIRFYKIIILIQYYLYMSNLSFNVIKRNISYTSCFVFILNIIKANAITNEMEIYWVKHKVDFVRDYS